MRIEQTNYTKEYLDGIKNYTFKRMDDVQRGGNGDGKVSVQEAFRDLNVTTLFSNLKRGSAEYNKLQACINKIPEAICEYAGDDEEFSAEEWAQFLNASCTLTLPLRLTQWLNKKQASNNFRSPINFFTGVLGQT